MFTKNNNYGCWCTRCDGRQRREACYGRQYGHFRSVGASLGGPGDYSAGGEEVMLVYGAHAQHKMTQEGMFYVTRRPALTHMVTPGP